MSEETSAAPSGGETQAAPVEIAGPADKPSISPRDAASFLASLRHKRDNPEGTAQQPEQEEAATEQPEGQEEAPQEQAAEETKPEPVKLPKSWQADREEAFKALPEDVRKLILDAEERHTGELTAAQKRLQEIEQARPKEVEAAKALQAQYEQALPALLQMMQQQTAGEFGDIKTHDDVTKLADQDPHRYLKFMAHQQKVQALQAQQAAVEERQRAEQDQRWQAFSAEQDEKFLAKRPEFAKDKTKAERATAATVEMLQDKGFTTQEMQDLWNGKSGVSLRDYRLQDVLLDAAMFREAMRAAKEAKAKPLPPVQRPGVSQPKGGDTAQVKALDERLNKTGSWKDAAALLAAKRRRAG